MARSARERQVAQVVAVEQHGAVDRVVEAQQQPRERRLARAARARQRDRLARPCDQVDARDRVARGARVAEARRRAARPRRAPARARARPAARPPSAARRAARARARRPPRRRRSGWRGSRAPAPGRRAATGRRGTRAARRASAAPWDSAHVPSVITTSTPSSSIRSTSGENSPRIRVAASSASTIRSPSAWKRATSASPRSSDCTSAALASDSSATAPSEPLRRRFSRAACLLSREKWRATQKNSGVTTSATSASCHWITNSARAEEQDPQQRREPVADPGEHERLDRLHVGGEPLRARRRAGACRASATRAPCTCANTSVRSRSRKRSPTHAATYSSPNEMTRSAARARGRRARAAAAARTRAARARRRRRA